MKLNLKTVTLVCADCVWMDQSLDAMNTCVALCDFGDVKLFTSSSKNYPYKVEIPPLTSLVDYSVWMLTNLAKHVQTPYLLVVQHDGWILNPSTWNPDWLAYDYIGPLFMQPPVGPDSVGTGGFSLRSTALMRYVASKLPPWSSSKDTDPIQCQLGCYEDGAICSRFKNELVHAGFKYAPLEEAAKFAQGGQSDPRFYVRRPFGFHRNVKVNLGTGEVEPVDPNNIPSGWL